MKWLMAPFVFFLIIFCYYSMVHFEAVDEMYREHGSTSTFLKIEGVLIRVCLLGLSLYFVVNELSQVKRAASTWDYLADVWNLIDWAPLILLAVSLLLSGVSQIRRVGIEDINVRVLHRNDLQEYEDNTTLVVQFERYLNSIICLLLWIKLYYFMRI